MTNPSWNKRFRKDVNRYYGNVATFEERYSDLEKWETTIFHEHYNVLDIGCAEGKIANHVATMVRSVVAFDADKKKVYEKDGRVSFYSCEFPNMPQTKDKRGRYFQYDTVLYLGVHHKLPQDKKDEAIMMLTRITKKYLVIRTSDALGPIINKIQVYRPIIGQVMTDGSPKAEPAVILLFPFAADK